MTTKTKKDVYQIVTDKIMDKLRSGTVPWKMPFQMLPAVNWKTQKPYRGVNQILLDSGEYATFNQIKEAGGTVKKGEKAHLVIFWKMLEKKGEPDEDKEYIPMLRYYHVFKVGEQTEGIEPKREIDKYDHDPLEEAERIIMGYADKPMTTYKDNGAYYLPLHDTVNIPPMETFENVNEYYSTYFHELVHSTGHSKRLAREGILKFDAFGSERYSKEELVAEIGASMLCGITGIVDETIDNSASYIEAWLKKLESDNRLIVSASQQAQRACDYMQGISYE